MNTLTLEKRTTTATPQRWENLNATEAFEIVARHEQEMDQEQEGEILAQLALGKLTYGDFRAYTE